VKGFKGFTKDLKCRDMQYEIGEEFTSDTAELCESGLHFCEHPLDCFSYYEPNESRFCEVETADEDVSSQISDDTKRVTKRLKIGVELSLSAMIQAAVKFVFDRAEWTDENLVSGKQQAAKNTGARGAASATGDSGAASATGDIGAASATGDRGAALVNGSYSCAEVTGDKSVACALGYDCSASGINGSILVLIERDSNMNIIHHKTVMVDGVKIKEKTAYKLKNGRVKLA